jgi:hypothetical protein
MDWLLEEERRVRGAAPSVMSEYNLALVLLLAGPRQRRKRCRRRNGWLARLSASRRS